ncbi:alpha-glucosides permease MPH2/3 [Apiospora phragmitis]|uniref:Alpha-glucosides permease MPH2/3 n=1 Tax=Apiospora phragmitis TaxID=2905665 RepID=A0ABR1SX23_9PEZI
MENLEKGQLGGSEHAEYVPDAVLIEAAIANSEKETQLLRKELFSRYWPGAVYSVLLSMALIMEGMDVGLVGYPTPTLQLLVNNFFGHQGFLNKFGWPDANGKQHIPTSWQSAIGNGNSIGSIIGLMLNGWLQSRYGFRRVYMGAMALMGGTIFALFFAVNVQMLFSANIQCGIPWGIFQTLTTAYAAEICPDAMRGYLTAWVSMCWGCGSFLAAGVLRASLDLRGDLGWKLPYALQWVWVVPLFVAALCAPESPWYLVRRGRVADAEKSLRRLARRGLVHRTVHEGDACAHGAYQRDGEDRVGPGKLQGLFQRHQPEANWYRGKFSLCMAWIIQILNGQSIASFATIFLRSAGMPQVQAFNYSMGIQSVNIFATAIAIALMGRIGRRVFYLYGSTGIGLLMLIIGILGFVPNQTNTAIAVAIVMIMVNFVFKISLGPTCYTIVGEASSSRVRAQTIVIGRAVYVVGQIAVNQLNPRMLNDSSDAWNWGAQTGLFYFGLCGLWAVWIFFFLPETKNRTFGELDYLFQKRIPARKFATAPVDRKYFQLLHPRPKLDIERLATHSDEILI